MTVIAFAQSVTFPSQSSSPHTYSFPGSSLFREVMNELPRNGSSNRLAKALLPALPLLMHSCGDALPEDVSPESAAVLSTLIEQYISSLVTVAVDAHDVLTDGEVVGGGAALGIPSFQEKRSGETRASMAGIKKRKIDYWDEPVSNVGGDLTSDDDDAPLLVSRRKSSVNSTFSFNESSACRAAMLDIHTSRVRKHYVTAATAMDVKSFIFPICHDAVLYQRVKELQSQRRQIRRDLTEREFMKVIKEEGEELGRGVGVDTWDAVWSAASEQAAATTAATSSALGVVVKAGLVDGEGVEASWPGLDVLQKDCLW